MVNLQGAIDLLPTETTISLDDGATAVDDIHKFIPNFKIACIGDQALGQNAVSVLQLIKDEGAHMVLHQGDFDYIDDPNLWDQQINDVLGDDFPYFASVGNHDVLKWSEYQQKLVERLAKVSGENCSGDVGVKSSCTFNGIFFILSGVGTLDSGHDTYIKNQLSQNNSIWRICTWHKNMNQMQLGTKTDDTGWEVYEECRKGGAMIVTGHEHTYSRTKTLTSIENQIVDSKSVSSDTQYFIGTSGAKNLGSSIGLEMVSSPTAKMVAEGQRSIDGSVFNFEAYNLDSQSADKRLAKMEFARKDANNQGNIIFYTVDDGTLNKKLTIGKTSVDIFGDLTITGDIKTSNNICIGTC